MDTPEHTLITRTNSDRSEDTFYTTCGYTQDTPQYINTCLNTVAIQSWFMYCASVGRIQLHTYSGPYFTYCRSAPGIPEKYTSKYTWNTTHVCVYSLGSPEYYLNTVHNTSLPYLRVAGRRPEYLRNTTHNTHKIQHASVCILWGLTWIQTATHRCICILNVSTVCIVNVFKRSQSEFDDSS